MAHRHKIAWTDKTWNPVTGCSPVSAGCKNCYAKRVAERLRRMGQPKYACGFDVTVHPECLNTPLGWKAPQRVFVCSMSDLFHEDVPDAFAGAVWAIMRRAEQHTFQVLTKRPENMLAWVGEASARGPVRWWMREALERYWPISSPVPCMVPEPQWPLSNLWLGVTAENQEWWEKRVDVLVQIPAAVGFVSLEPLLGPVAMHLALADRWARIDWVIVGAESGPGRRPCKIEWVRDIVQQCRGTGKPVFVKQLDLNGRLSKDMAKWPEDLRVREFPATDGNG